MARRHGLRADARAALRDVREFGWQPRRLRGRLEVLRGERAGRVASRVRVFSVVRNGAAWLERFLGHHRALGDVDFAFLLNDSRDDTRERLLAEPDTVVLRSDVPYARYENTLKRHLLDRHGAGRWCLFLDIDELFDFPGSESRSLDELIAYLDAHRFDAVVTQMLDLFPAGPVGASSVEEHVFHELASIRRTLYPPSMRLRNDYPRALSDGSIASHRGGVRARVFGSDNGLTKVSLLKNVAGLESFVQWHHCRGARFADLSCALLHYPFAHGFRGKVDEAVRSGRYGAHTTDEYVRYGRALAAGADPVLHSENAIRFSGTRALTDCGFLHAPPTYEDWSRAS